MFFSFLLKWLVPQVNYWWKVVRMGSFSCVSILKENIQYFNIKCNISFGIFSWMSLIKLRRFPPLLLQWHFSFFKTTNRWHIWSKAFLKVLEMIICFFPFILLIWRVALIALRVLNSLAVGTNSADLSSHIFWIWSCSFFVKDFFYFCLLMLLVWNLLFL